MSADNFFVLRRHPNGGFAWVMGFASDDENHALTGVVSESAEQFETIEAAVRDYNENVDNWGATGGYYPKYYNEYGMSISNECYDPIPDESGTCCVGVGNAEECPPFPDQRFVVLIHDTVRDRHSKVVIEGNPNGGYTARPYRTIDNDLEKTFIVLGN